MTVKVSGSSGLIFLDGILQSYGDSNDLQINHDGSNSYINDAGTGNLRLQTGGSTKLEVTSSGIDVTGTVTSDGLTVDSSSATLQLTSTTGSFVNFGDSADTNVGAIQYWHVDNRMAFKTNDLERLRILSDGDIYFYEDTGTTAKFFWDASAESLGIGTTSSAVATNVKTTLNSSANSGGGIQLFYNNAGGGAITANTGVGLQFYTVTGTIGAEGYTERMRIDSSGNVGIGTSSPAQKLEVDGDIRILDAGSLFFKRYGDNYAWRIRNESAANSSDGGYTGTNTLMFEVAVDSSQQVASSTTSHTLYGSSVNTLALTENGKVGIGTSSPSAGLHILKDVNPTLKLDRGSANSTNANLYYNGTFTGQISAASAGFEISAVGASTPMKFYTNGSERMRILSSGGITFNGDTSSANALDDYEEGTWTPSFSQGSPTIQQATYTKIGNLVNVRAYLNGNFNTSSTVEVEITNLPFTSSSSCESNGPLTARYINFSGYLQTVNFSNSSRLEIRDVISGSNYSYIGYNNISSSSCRLFINHTYMVA